MRWLELAPGYACNAACLGCHACNADPQQQMAFEEVVRWLQTARRRGAQHLWLSGGEPTLRKDFLGTLRAARQFGYQRIKVQTNGMLFAYEHFAERAVAAGMNEASLLLRSLDPARHDALHRTQGGLRALQQGLERLRATGIRLEGDVLLTADTIGELPAIVRHYTDLGLRHFNLWLFSLADQGDADLRALVPRLTDAMPFILEARTIAQQQGATVCSLASPHCTLPPHAWDLLFDAAGMDMLVVNPGGQAFKMEASRLEAGAFHEPCQTCAVRGWCHGLRPDYVSVHGTGELRTLSEAEVAGFDPRGSVLDLP